jgi:hypothetical protein
VPEPFHQLLGGGAGGGGQSAGGVPQVVEAQAGQLALNGVLYQARMREGVEPILVSECRGGGQSWRH